MARAICLISLLVAPFVAEAQDRVIGLLSLPEAFGSAACERFNPQAVGVHAAPDSDPPVASIRVDRYWTFPAAGGCEGLHVAVQAPDGRNIGELPTREQGYETPAAIVLERRGEWFRIRLPAGTGWVHASARDDYFPLEQLLADGLTYLTDAAEGRLASTAGGDPSTSLPGTPGSERSVRLVESQMVNGELWLRLEVLSHSPCESGDEPTVVSRGWLPAHGSSGEPTVWFYSRGC